jgi:hypothetical protein
MVSLSQEQFFVSFNVRQHIIFPCKAIFFDLQLSKRKKKTFCMFYSVLQMGDWSGAGHAQEVGVGCRGRDTGSRIQRVRCRERDTGSRIQRVGCRERDTGSRIQKVGCRERDT